MTAQMSFDILFITALSLALSFIPTTRASCPHYLSSCRVGDSHPGWFVAVLSIFFLLFIVIYLVGQLVMRRRALSNQASGSDTYVSAARPFEPMTPLSSPPPMPVHPEPVIYIYSPPRHPRAVAHDIPFPWHHKLGSEVPSPHSIPKESEFTRGPTPTLELPAYTP